MAFKILYHEDSLADLEEIFEWSRDKHPETMERFASDLFDHIDLLQALPYIGTPVKGHRGSGGFCILPCTPINAYYRVDENREAVEILHFWPSSRKAPRL